jgi:RHS repeat-associated protein
LLAIVLSGAASAQTSGPNARTAPGVPFNSYTLDNLESINYFNGRMHFGLPLLNVSGRGSARQTVMLTIDPQYPSEGKGCPNCPNYYQLSAAIWNYEVGYGPGVLEAVVEGREMQVQCQSNAVSDFNNPTRTFMRFKTSDGTEYSLFDLLHDGQLMPNPDGCSTDQHAALRGKVFVTKDGSSATFVSDVDIYDNRYGLGGEARYFPSGVLKLRDGTRYRIDNGVVSWSSDRNGNKIVYEYYPPVAPIVPLPNSSFPGRVKKITDSLGREAQFTYDNPTGIATERYDEITYKGFGGQPRAIRVYYARLEHALRNPNDTIQTYCQLGVDCETPNGGVIANPLVVSSVVLPDNRSFHFYYDRYAELSRYELPTGGAVEYDYDWGLHLSVFASDTYRRIVQRRTYPTGGTDASFESKTTYTKPEHSYQQSGAGSFYYAGATTGYVEVDHIGKPNGVETLLSRERHYYYGMAGAPAVSSNVPGAVWWSAPPVHGDSSYAYHSWHDGREYKTEYMSSDGASPLRRVEYNWQQSANPTWWVLSPDLAPENNPRIAETVTTLLETNQVSKQSSLNPYDTNDKGFDQYNNRTDLWEYDYGDGGPGALLRHTHTNFITSTNYTDGVNGPSLISLPSQTSVYDGMGIERGRTTFEYDNYSQDGVFHAGLLPRSLISGLCDGTAQNCLGSPNFTDPNYVTRGNETGVTRYLLDGNGSVMGSIAAYAQYDIAGNIVKAIDPRGYATTFDYNDNFGAPDGEARSNTPPLELSSHGQSSYTFPTLVTNALGQTIYTQFDFYLGQAVNSEDANGIVSSVSYNDALDRPKQLIRAANGGADVKRQTTINYDDLNHVVTTTSDQTNYADNLLKSETVSDGLGRTLEKRQYETTGSYIAVRQNYDGLGRSSQTSNPFRSGETILWTTTAYDELSRVTSVTSPDGASVKTNYSGNRALAADQNDSDQLRKKRISKTDALGRLKDLWEITAADGATESVSFPSWPSVTAGYHTSYEYDALDDLAIVHQGGQTRTFFYDSLKRLSSAMNPENGTVGYQYDENGNLRVKTDARGVSTHFSYDALNRVTRRWYNRSTSLTAQTNNSPALPGDVATSDEVAYVYDSQGLPSGAPPNFSRGSAIGRLVAVAYGTSSSAGDYYGYDAAGRPVLKIQQTAGTNYQINAAYNLADAITSQFYPSGHIVSYGYDKAGRTTSMTGRLGDGRNRTYSTGISYSPFGGLAQEQFGTQTSLYHKLHYNQRGQLFDIRLSSYSLAANEWDWNRGALVSYYSSNYSWGGNSTGSGLDNNGNVTREQHWTPTADPNSYSYTQDTYSYDSLNRLTSANEVHGGPNWQSGQDYLQSYDYDRFGNRTINSASTGVNNTQFDKSDAQNSNRLYAPNDLSQSMSQRKMQYDSAGNLTHDSYTGDNRTRSFDAENRLSLLSFPVPPPPPPVCYPDGEGGQTCYPVDPRPGPPPIQYVYDGDGHRVRRFINDQETRQVYGLGGELLAEYAASISPTALQKEYGYRNGQLLITATPAAGTYALGSPQSGKDTSSTALLAKLNSVELPRVLRGLLLTNADVRPISDSSTPLYGPAFPYASLNRSVLFSSPQSTSTKIAFSSNRDGTAQIYSMNSDGSGAQRLTNDAANDEYPRWAPNGSRIVFQSDRDNIFSGMADIYVMNTDGSGQTRLTSDANDDSAPAWSPDGSKIVFQSARNGVNYQIYVMNTDGSGQVNISNSAANDTQPSWSPDGTKIAFASDRDHSGYSSVYVMNSTGANQTRLTFGAAPYADDQPSWSPNSSKIAFTSTRDSTTDTWTETDDDGNVLNRSRVNINKEVYVMNANGFGQTRLTNTLENDESPSWSGDGTRIVFRSDRERDCCDPTPQVWMMNADGSNQLNLSNDQVGNYNPSWCDAVMSPPPPNSAQFVSQSVPQTMTAGQTYAVWVRMKNIGSNTWTTQGAYSLGSQNAQDNTTWGLGRVALPSFVASGSEVTFNFSVTAPSTTGTYNFQWRMVQDGVEWFGAFSPNVSVTVISQSGGNTGTDPDPSTPYADVRWIVADRLGTPRMILAESGSLANVSRHDYLPFGEELTGQIGGRTTQQGYTGDSTRQKFTQKERDVETGLDYFGSRYYGSVQGRFTSVDPLAASASLARPQSWNRYAYVLNNPIRLIDRSGQSPDDPEDQQPKSKPAKKDGDTFSGPSCPGICPNPATVAEVKVPFGPAAPQPTQTNETPIVTTLSPSVGPSSGPIPQTPASESRKGLFGVNYGGFAAVGYGGMAGIDSSVNAGVNFSGNGGIGVAGSFGTVITDEGIGPGFGYPSDEAYGYGLAASAGPGLFYSNAATYADLRGPFDTTIIATPIITIQYDSAVGDATRVFSFSGPSGLGIFHFRTTTPAWSTIDVPVNVPLNKY